MYDLYWAEGTVSFAPQAVLEEADLPYNLIPVDFAARVNRAPDYLAVNPLGLVPALCSPDGTVITEAAAICLHLIEKHDLDFLAPGPGEDQRASFLQWLFYLTSSLQMAYKRYYYPERFTTDPAHTPAIRERSLSNLEEVWAPVERHLAESGPHMLLTRYSLLDIYVVMIASWHPDRNNLFASFPILATHIGRISERPAIARCLARQTGLSVGR